MNWTRYFGFFPFLFFGIFFLPIVCVILLLLLPIYVVLGVLNLWEKVKP